MMPTATAADAIAQKHARAVACAERLVSALLTPAERRATEAQRLVEMASAGQLHFNLNLLENIAREAEPLEPVEAALFAARSDFVQQRERIAEKLDEEHLALDGKVLLRAKLDLLDRCITTCDRGLGRELVPGELVRAFIARGINPGAAGAANYGFIGLLTLTPRLDVLRRRRAEAQAAIDAELAADVIG